MSDCVCNRRGPCLGHANRYAPMPNYCRPWWLPYSAWKLMTIWRYRVANSTCGVALKNEKPSRRELTVALAFWVDRADRFERQLPEHRRYMAARGAGTRQFLTGRRASHSQSVPRP